MTEVFMITGPAGSGKTTLGLALADRIGAVTLDLDDVAADLVATYRSAHPEVAEARALTLLRDRRYAVLVESARSRLAGHEAHALVLIAPFTSEISSATEWTAWLHRLGVSGDRVHLVWLHLSADERLRRLATRAESRDVDVVAAGDLPESRRPGVPAMVVEADQPIAAQVESVLQRFGNG